MSPLLAVNLLIEFSSHLNKKQINLTAKIKQNADFNAILQNRIEKARAVCICIWFLFFRPLHTQLSESASPLLLSLL